jgi:branched-chain amino acid transport system ATP-binding protein
MLMLDSVSKTFGGLQAVHRITLSVTAGEIVGLIGPNGAGKTTLFNLVTGTYRPDTGCILFRGQNITRLGPHQRCQRGIARTFQLVRPFHGLSVLDNVAVGRLYGSKAVWNRRQAEAESYESLELVGLATRAADPAGHLTLVDRKRLELARALATRPMLLLLDELLAGLNPTEVLEAMQLIQQIRTMGVTIVMVEHLVKAIFSISDRVVVLNAGEKIAEGAPAAVAHHPQVIDAYLGAPHVA